MVGMAKEERELCGRALIGPKQHGPDDGRAERETPGTSARHWNRPILKASEGG